MIVHTYGHETARTMANCNSMIAVAMIRSVISLLLFCKITDKS